MAEKKKKIIIITSAVFVLLIIAALTAGGYVWYLPGSRQKQLEAEFLVRHQHIFRVSKVQAVNASTFMLYDLELGSKDRPVLTAPQATLQLASAVDKDLNSLKLKKLQLHDCQIKADTSKKSLLINDVPLKEILLELAKLPRDRKNLQLPLEIAGVFLCNGQPPSSNIKLTLTFASNGSLTASGSWSDIKHPQVKGSWSCTLDTAHKQLSLSLQDCISEHFFKQILQNAKLPPTAVNVIKAGVLTGKGSVTASFPDMSIKRLQYDGRLFHPELLWYGKTIKLPEEFDFSLTVKENDISLTIPQMQFNAAGNVTVNNVDIKFSKDRSYMLFTAETDLFKLSENFFAKSFNSSIAAASAAPGKFSGKWDFRSGKWSAAGKTDKKTPASLTLAAPGKVQIFFTPDNFDFTAGGKGGSGWLKNQLYLKKLEINSPGGIFKTEQGVVFASAKFDTHSTISSDLEFNFATLACDNGKGQLEISGLGGMLNMRNEQNGREINLICNGKTISLVSPAVQAVTGKWNGTVTLKSNPQHAVWELSAIDLNIPEIQLSYQQKQYDIKNTVLRADAQLKNLSDVIKYDLLFNADKITADNILFEVPSLRSIYDKNKPAGSKINCKFSSRKAVLPDNPLALRKFLNGVLEFSTDDLTQLPQAVKFKSSDMQLHSRTYNTVLKNSSWQLTRTSPENIDCSVNFGSMQAKTEKYGSGSSTAGSLLLHIMKAKNSFTAEKIFADGNFKQISWRYGDLYSGGKDLHCSIEYNAGTPANINTALKLKNANFLSKHFSADTPEFSVKANWRYGGLDGNIKFAPGSISDPQGGVELRDAEFTLPFNTAIKAPEKLPKGFLTAKGLWILQENEGAFSAELEHFSLLSADSSSILAHTLKAQGTLHAAKFNNRPFNIAVLLNLPPAPQSGHWSFELPESALSSLLPISKYIPIEGDPVILKGQLALKGEIECFADKPIRGQINLHCVNTDWKFKDIFANQLTTGINFTLSGNQLSSQPAHITIGKLQFADNQTMENELDWTLTNNSEQQISAWSGKLPAGSFRLNQPIAINTAKNAFPEMLIEVKDLPANELFSSQRITSVICDAPLSGKMQLQIVPEYAKIFIRDCNLAFKTPAGTLLQIKLNKNDTIKTASRSQRDFTLAVLKSMKCYLGQFSMQTSADEIALQLKAEGVPAEPVPFVYQGRNGKTPFRNAAPGEKGFDGELELNVNLKLHPAAPDVEQPERI